MFTPGPPAAGLAIPLCAQYSDIKLFLERNGIGISFPVYGQQFFYGHLGVKLYLIPEFAVFCSFSSCDFLSASTNSEYSPILIDVKIDFLMSYVLKLSMFI